MSWEHVKLYLCYLLLVGIFFFYKYNTVNCPGLVGLQVNCISRQRFPFDEFSAVNHTLMNTSVFYFHKERMISGIVVFKSLLCWVAFPPKSICVSRESAAPCRVLLLESSPLWSAMAAAETPPMCHKNDNGLFPLFSLWAISFWRLFGNSMSFDTDWHICIHRCVPKSLFFFSFENLFSSRRTRWG